MTPEEYRALPFAQIRLTHGFPSPSREHQTLAIVVDGEPVALLAAVKVGFEQDYSYPYGHMTLKLIAGDCLIVASRPKLPTHHDPQQGSAVQTAAPDA